MFNSIIDGQSMSIVVSLICFLTALFLGMVIAFVHLKTVRTNKNFIITLIILPLLVSIIMMMVNGNLGTSVAVLGAFSLIRFRSIPGNSREITSIFLAMAVGLSIGMGQLLFAVVSTLLISLVLFILSSSKTLEGKANGRILKVVIPDDLDYDQIFDEILSKHTKEYVLEQVRTVNLGSMFEIKYNIRIDNSNIKTLIDEIRVRNGNMKVTISEQVTENNL